MSKTFGHNVKRYKRLNPIKNDHSFVFGGSGYNSGFDIGCCNRGTKKYFLRKMNKKDRVASKIRIESELAQLQLDIRTGYDVYYDYYHDNDYEQYMLMTSGYDVSFDAWLDHRDADYYDAYDDDHWGDSNDASGNYLEDDFYHESLDREMCVQQGMRWLYDDWDSGEYYRKTREAIARDEFFLNKNDDVEDRMWADYLYAEQEMLKYDTYMYDDWYFGTGRYAPRDDSNDDSPYCIDRVGPNLDYEPQKHWNTNSKFGEYVGWYNDAPTYDLTEVLEMKKFNGERATIRKMIA